MSSSFIFFKNKSENKFCGYLSITITSIIIFLHKAHVQVQQSFY